MINLWTQEWGWSDWRAQHSHLNDKEAKTLYLMEQAMYQDMHTQHIINNINAPAGGGAVSGNGDIVTMQWTIDLNNIKTGDALGTTKSVSYYYLKAFAPPAFDLKDTLTGRLQDLTNKDPSATLTVDWGDGLPPEEVSYTGWHGYNDFSTPAEFEAKYGDGTTPWTGGDQEDKDLRLYQNFYDAIRGGKGWRHQYAAPGVYNIKVTGHRDFVYMISPIYTSDSSARYAFLANGYPNWPNDYQTSDNAFNLFYPLGPTKDIIIPDNLYVEMPAFPGHTSNKSTLIHNATNGWHDIRQYPSSIIDLYNNMWNSNGNIKFLGSAPFWGVTYTREAGLDVSNWDMSSCIRGNGIFYGVCDVPQGISNWDTSNMTTMTEMFRRGLPPSTLPPGDFPIGFNQDISNWDTSKVTSIRRFLEGQTSPNCDFDNTYMANWNLSSLTDARDCFKNTSCLSDANLETIIKGWADNPNTADNVSATNLATSRTYAAGSDMDLAIQALTAKGWTISGITIS